MFFLTQQTNSYSAQGLFAMCGDLPGLTLDPQPELLFQSSPANNFHSQIADTLLRAPKYGLKCETYNLWVLGGVTCWNYSSLLFTKLTEVLLPQFGTIVPKRSKPVLQCVTQCCVNKLLLVIVAEAQVTMLHITSFLPFFLLLTTFFLFLIVSTHSVLPMRTSHHSFER